MAGGVTPKEIWDQLERARASAVQAAGIMGNWISESGLNPEAKAMDSNGHMSYGLAQWNTASYPDAAKLVTGNPRRDLREQINYLSQTGGIKAARGTTVAETAGNYAADYERCVECQPGGAQYQARVAQAATVAGWASAGNWPTSPGGATDTATLTAAQVQEQGKGQQACAWSIGWGGIPDTSWLHWLGLGGSGNIGSGEVCLLSKVQLRVLIGVGLLGVGLISAEIGLNWIIKAAVSAEVASKLGPALSVLGPEGAAVGAAAQASAPKPKPPKPPPPTTTATQEPPRRRAIESGSSRPKVIQGEVISSSTG